jgi:carbon-monoxide dehydrogenase medium subunit
MFGFNYHRPEQVEAAIELARGSHDGKFLAGGQTLIPTLKQRLAGPGDLIDLGAIAGLAGIDVTAETVVIGAMTRHADVAASSQIRHVAPALAELAGLIGDPAVRNRGTIGGSLANNDPSADYPAACLALGGTILTDRRAVAADDFFLGMFETALEDDEIVTAVSFPIPLAAAYRKFANPASRYAMAGSFVARTQAGVRVAITGAGQDGVFRWTEAEEALAIDFTDASLAGLELSADAMIGDMHGDGAYRAHLAAVITRRALAALAVD